jgi:hypothetical protein
MTVEQRDACAAVLRAAGYSAAWILLSDDYTDTGFLVPPADLDWTAPYESPRMRDASIALMGELPGTKTFVGPYRDDLPVERLY